MAKSTTDLMEKAALQITAPAKVVPNSRAVLFSKANKALKNIKMISALAASCYRLNWLADFFFLYLYLSRSLLPNLFSFFWILT